MKSSVNIDGYLCWNFFVLFVVFVVLLGNESELIGETMPDLFRRCAKQYG